MTTSRLTAAVAVVVALLVAPAVAPAKKPVEPRCPDRPGLTLSVNGGVRLYDTFVQSRSDPDASVTRIFSCTGNQRSARLLARWNNDLDETQRVRHATVAGGRWVVLTVDVETGVSEGDYVVEFDATTGKEVASIESPEDSAPLGRLDSYFGNLQVSGGGGVAFESPAGLEVADQDGLVVKVPADGSDTPTTFDLAASATHFYWTVTKTGVPGATVTTGHPKGALKG